MRILFLLIALVFSLTTVAQLAVPDNNGLTYGHVELNVTDVELHKQIWTEFFGGTVVQKGPLTTVRLPNMLLVLTEAEPTMGSQQTTMDHFGFKVRDTAAFLERWEAAGYVGEEIFIGAEGHRNAYVMVPDGVYVELQEDRALPLEISGYHIHFRAPGHEELLAWYADVFELEILPRGSIATTTNVPGMNLSFGPEREGEDRQPTHGAAIDNIGFELDDLEAFCQKLADKGIEFDMEITEFDDIELKIALFTDPAGVRIKLTEGFDNY